MESLKDSKKPDRGPMIAYLTSAREASRKDAIGVLRFSHRFAVPTQPCNCRPWTNAWLGSSGVFFFKKKNIVLSNCLFSKLIVYCCCL